MVRGRLGEFHLNCRSISGEFQVKFTASNLLHSSAYIIIMNKMIKVKEFSELDIGRGRETCLDLLRAQRS